MTKGMMTRKMIKMTVTSWCVTGTRQTKKVSSVRTCLMHRTPWTLPSSSSSSSFPSSQLNCVFLRYGALIALFEWNLLSLFVYLQCVPKKRIFRPANIPNHQLIWWSGIDNPLLIDGKPESAFFETPCMFTSVTITFGLCSSRSSCLPFNTCCPIWIFAA